MASEGNDVPASKQAMTPGERAAIKAAQERALRLEVEREAAKAAADGTAVVATTGLGAPAPAAPVWRVPAADQDMAVAQPDTDQLGLQEPAQRAVRVRIKRRRLLRGGIFASLAGLGILSIGSFLNFFNPRHISGFGGVVAIAKDDLPQPGDDPMQVFDMNGYIVFLKPGEGGSGAIPGSKNGGLLALYWKCPHLGCTVPWRSDFEFQGTKGWFLCPCHGSTYTRGGARVAGPAPRSMDTFDLTIMPNGSLSVDTGTITLGDMNDPQRGKLPAA